MFLNPENSYLDEALHLNKICKISPDVINDRLTLHLNQDLERNPYVKYSFERQDHFINAVTIFYDVFNEAPPFMKMVVSLYNFTDKLIGKFVKADFKHGKNVQTIELKNDCRIKSVSFEYSGAKQFSNSKLAIDGVVFYNMNPLTQLANKFGSDKGSEIKYAALPHLYTNIYEPLFKKFKNRKINLLEIGLDTKTYHSGDTIDAPSLSMWLEYFSKAEIYGIDINDYDFLNKIDRLKFYRANQSSRRELGNFKKKYKTKFDIIIDDASHASSHQQISLVELLPLVKKGGYYIIEDLFWQPFTEKQTTLELFEHLEYSGTFNSPYLTDKENKYIMSKVKKFEIVKAAVSEVLIIHM